MQSEKEKLPFHLCIVSQWRFDDLDSIPGKPISEAIRLAETVKKVVFVCYNEEGKYLSKRLAPNLFVYTVPLLMSNSLVHTLKNMLTQFTSMTSFLCKIVEQHEIDFIRAENIILGGIPTYICSKLSALQYAIWLAGFEDRVIKIRYGDGIVSKIIQGLFTLLRKRILSSSEFAVGVSAELLEESKMYTQSPVILTPNFVDFESFRQKDEYDAGQGLIRLVYIGRLESEKGIDILLEAVDMIKHRDDFILHVVGWGSLLDNVLNASKNGTPIEYLGKKPHKEIPRVLFTSDILILPSLTEGMPAVILEALATGTPVIASSVGQIPSVIRHQKEGILIQPNDADQLRQAIESLLDNREMIRDMGRQTRKRAMDISGKYMAFHRALFKKFV
ncbi:MAG: glycosyltransferase [Candidatus Lokiarchaeota archaeon]|nr:glycosyltransferase [Candidatus Lokiarchaeota archaeon]